MSDITTGDPASLAVTLRKAGAVFTISGTATVKAMLISLDHNTTYTGEIAQLSTTDGADWANSLVMVFIPGTETQGISYQGAALLEVQVSESATDVKTWFVSVTITKGNIA